MCWEKQVIKKPTVFQYRIKCQQRTLCGHSKTLRNPETLPDRLLVSTDYFSLSQTAIRIQPAPPLKIQYCKRLPTPLYIGSNGGSEQSCFTFSNLSPLCACTRWCWAAGWREIINPEGKKKKIILGYKTADLQIWRQLLFNWWDRSRQTDACTLGCPDSATSFLIREEAIRSTVKMDCSTFRGVRMSRGKVRVSF